MKRTTVFCAAVVLLATEAAALASGPPEPEYMPYCSTPQQIAPMQAAGGILPHASSAIAWNGKDFAAVWVDSADNHLHFRRFFADGTPAAPAVTVSTLYSYDSMPPSLVWNGSGYAVAWTASAPVYYQAYFARLDASGTLIGSVVKASFAGSTETTAAYYAAVAFSGSGYAVCWYDARNGTSDIFATLLDASGAITYHDIVICPAAMTQCYPAIAWSSAVGKYEIVWQDFRSGSKYEIWGSQLSTTGSAGANTSLVSSTGSSTYPYIVDAGSGLGMVWQDFRDGNAEVYFARLSASGTKIGSDLRVTNDSNFSNYPIVAWTGAEYGIFWSDTRGGANYDTWFQRVSASGALAGSNTQASYTAGAAFPGAAFARYGYLATSLYLDSVGYGENMVLPWGCASDTTPPSCPMNFVAYNVTGTSATVAWIPSVEDYTDIAYYEVYRNDALAARTSDNYYADSGLSLGTTYNYYVRPVNAAQLVNGTCTSSIYLKTNATLTLMLNKNDPNAHLTWSDITLNNYSIFRGTSPQVMSQIGSTGGCQFDDPNVLTDNVLYFYTVDEPGW